MRALDAGQGVGAGGGAFDDRRGVRRAARPGKGFKRVRVIGGLKMHDDTQGSPGRDYRGCRKWTIRRFACRATPPVEVALPSADATALGERNRRPGADPNRVWPNPSSSFFRTGLPRISEMDDTTLSCRATLTAWDLSFCTGRHLEHENPTTANESPSCISLVRGSLSLSRAPLR